MKHGRVKPFKYSPFISAGVISLASLKDLVLQMEREGATTVKFTGETIFVWDTPHGPDGFELRLPYPANQFKYGGVRPVKLCSAETFCQNFKRPVLNLARELDRRFHNYGLEKKAVIGVAGCQRSCSEPATKDIGVIAHPQGYEIMVGGSAGMKPRIARRLAIVQTEADVIEFVERILDYLKEHGASSMRLGRLIDKRGWDDFAAAVTPAHLSGALALAAQTEIREERGGEEGD